MKKITLFLLLTTFCFVLNAQTTVDCSSAPVNTTYCYTDNDMTTFTFISNDNSPLTVLFNAGQTEVSWDQLIVLDSDGVTNLNASSPYGNSGDLSGLTFTSSGDSITIGITSDSSINCGENNYTVWDFDVSCVDTSVVPNCDSVLTSPTNGQTNVSENTTINWGTASGIVTGYNLSVGTSSGATNVLNNQDVGNILTYDPGALTEGTTYFVTITPYNNNGSATSCIEESFTVRTNPNAPSGVNCASGSSSFIFTEDFESNPASGWTGTSFTGGNGDWDITAGDSNSPDTGPSASYNGNMHLEYEASGSSSTIASAISPIIDLSSAIDEAELSFYMHAYGANIGTLNIGISNSQSGPFTNIFTWSGNFQATGTDAWLPIGINLDPYLGQTVYLEFSYGATGNGFQGDMSIDYIRVETCGSFCITPSNLNATTITDNSATIYWSASNGESQWQYVIQPQGTGTPTGSGTTVTSTTFTDNTLTPNTAYEVYVRTDCGSSEFSIWNGPLNFTTPAPQRITFTTQSSGASGTYQIAVVDMNGDFLDDIVSVSSTNVNIRQQLSTGGFITKNITTTSANNLPSWSLAAADFDRNGYTDLLYGGGSGVTFMKANNTGTAFNEINFIDPNTNDEYYVFSQRSNFADINNDGDLDAFVCHDVDPSVYYLNDGNGNLTYYQSGNANAPFVLGDYISGGNYASIWIDYDNDRDLDMFMAKCGGETARRTNQMYTNNSGVYTENAAAIGLADPIQTWSCAWGDFDNDGDMDVFVGSNSGGESHKLMQNNGGTFTQVSSSTSGINALTTISREHVTFDFDNDGNLDVVSGGSILFGNGDMTFELMPNVFPSTGSYGDLNNDGFIDAFNSGSIYMNNGVPGNNWVTLNTVGVSSNINGIGARVEVHTASGTYIRDVKSGDGFEFMNSLNTYIGIGTEAAIDNIIIYWPSGIIDNLQGPAINTVHNIVEGQTLSVLDEELVDISIYPNPAKEILNINTSASLANRVATIFDINGKSVYNTKMDDTNTLNVSTLQSGIYFLRIESNGMSVKKKFIKE